jgi:hypothetical protein
MSRVIHHWPIRKNVTAVAVATALPKGMIIPKMKKGVLSIGHFEDMHVEEFKGPPWRAFFNLSPEPCGLSENSVISVRGSGMNSVGGSVTMNEQDVLLDTKKQRTRVTLHYRIVIITAACELLGSTN